MNDGTNPLPERIAAARCTPFVRPALFRELTAGLPRRDAVHRGSVTITIGDRELREGRDFDVDYATGVVTMHRGGVATITAPAWWTAPKPAYRRRVAQWKSERRGGRRP